LMDEKPKARPGRHSKNRGARGPNFPKTLAEQGVDKHLAKRGARAAPQHRLRWRARVKESFMSSVPRRRARKRLPNPDRRRALELLAGCGPRGCTEATMLAHGFTVDQAVELVRAGLASATECYAFPIDRSSSAGRGQCADKVTLQPQAGHSRPFVLSVRMRMAAILRSQSPERVC